MEVATGASDGFGVGVPAEMATPLLPFNSFNSIHSGLDFDSHAPPEGPSCQWSPLGRA